MIVTGSMKIHLKVQFRIQVMQISKPIKEQLKTLSSSEEKQRLY